MHPLHIAIDAALNAGLDFFIVVGGNEETRRKMGFPPAVARLEQLLLQFPAVYHRYAQPVGDENGLTCQLSFDALYTCRVPWSQVRQFILNHPVDESWPDAWKDEQDEAAATPPPDPSEPPPDNIRQFKPRRKKRP